MNYNKITYTKTGSCYPAGLQKEFLETAHLNMSMDAPDLISAGAVRNCFWTNIFGKEDRMVVDAVSRPR